MSRAYAKHLLDGVAEYDARSVVTVSAILSGIVAIFGAASTRVVANDDCPNCVIVAVDLDPSAPGFQTSLEVAPGTTWVRDVEVWIHDPNESASIYSIGYLGGLNRGIAFGHMPMDGQHIGQVISVNATSVEPIISGHTASVSHDGIEKLFIGPELQYFEYGSTSGVIDANPTTPVVTLDIELANAAHGDIFKFYLGDMTAVWLAQWPVDPGGAFSTQGLGSLDAGGDGRTDGTATAYGINADIPVPSPPAPFLVDYVDSPNGGGATIRVVSYPVPTISEWGLVVLTLLLFSSGAIILARRRSITN